MFLSSSSSQWRWNGEQRRSVVGESELARLADHLPPWNLHWRASDKTQMEVSRLLQVIKMVGIRWWERDAPNGGRKPEFGGDWWQSSRSPIFRRELLQALSSYSRL